MGFNQTDELETLHKGVPPLSSREYISQPAFIGSQQTLQYNIWGQLSDVKTVKEGNGATQALEAYSYDQNGNRLHSKQKVGQNSYSPSYSYRPASDQLQNIQLGTAKTSYSYNSHGEPVQISTADGDPSTSSGQATQTRDLTYGARGELLAIADQGKPTASYQYNHALQRVSKTIHPSTSSGRTVTTAETTNYLWHGGMIDAEIQKGQVTKRYIFINLRPVAVIEDGQIYAIHTDHLGTPQAITDDKQAVVWRADYATFGKATVQARVVDSSSKTAKTNFGIISAAHAADASSPQADASISKAKDLFEFNLRFAGQYEDVESGYHYNWHRYYDPSTGRYLTPDPIGLAGGLNGYGYAGQDPMGAVDPTGLFNYLLSPSETYGERAAVYARMQQDLQLAGIDVKWFGVASELNTAFAGVVAVPGDPWMNDLGKYLFQKNVATYNELMRPRSPNACYLSGKALDYSLVNKEQMAVQDFIKSNMPSPQHVLPIDLAFSDAGRIFMPPYLRTALERTENARGQNYNFWDTRDRIALGKTLMDRARGEWE